MPHQPYNPDSAADYRDEVTNLLFDLGVGGDRLGDLFTQPDPEALTQAVNRNVNGADADAAVGGQVCPQSITVAAREESANRENRVRNNILRLLLLILLFVAVISLPLEEGLSSGPDTNRGL